MAEIGGSFEKFGVDTGSRPSDISYIFWSICLEYWGKPRFFLLGEIPNLDLNPEKSHSYQELLWLSSGTSNQRQDSA